MILDIQIPTRKQVIEEHKRNGGLVAAVFPIHYPRALFRAQGILPVEVWGPPSADKTLGDAHLQAYTCSIVRLGLSYLIAGRLDIADMFVIPHCCDTLQGLGSLINDFISREKPIYTLYVPRERREIDIDFFSKELSALSAKLQTISKTTAGQEELIEAIETEERATDITKTLFENRLKLPCSNRVFYELVRSREYLPAEQFITFAEQALLSVGEKDNDGQRIVLSGVAPEPMEVLEVLMNMGAIIVADDLLSTGRRLYATRKQPDPWVRMAETIIKGPPDSTRGSSFESRLAHLLNLVRQTNAQGVVFYQVKFCEPEQFYLPALRKGLDEAKIPSLLVELDIGDSLPSQVVVRLEAFMESLS